MAPQMKQRRFRLRPVATVVAVAFTALFSGLGVWQLHRAQEKDALAAAFEAQRALPPLRIGSQPVDIADHRYRDATARGRFAQNHQIYVDNVVHEGRPGYEVFTPLTLDSGQGQVLIDRGWVPQGSSRGERPSVPVPEGPVTVSGWLDYPRSLPVIVAGDVPADDTFWPYLDLDALTRRVGAPLPRYVIHAEAPGESGLHQKNPKFDAKVGMHIGYAIQWFAFAAVAAGTYFAVNLKRTA